MRTFSKKANLQFRQRSGGYRVTGIPIRCTLGDPRTRSKAERREWRGKDRCVEARRRRYEKCVTPADALRPWEIRLGYRIVIAAGYRSSPSRNGRPDRYQKRKKPKRTGTSAVVFYISASVAGCRFYSVIVSRTKRSATRRFQCVHPTHYLFHEPLNANDNKRFLNSSNDWDKYADDNTINRLYRTGMVIWRIILFSFFSRGFRNELVEKTNTKPITCKKRNSEKYFFPNGFRCGKRSQQKIHIYIFKFITDEEYSKRGTLQIS